MEWVYDLGVRLIAHETCSWFCVKLASKSILENQDKANARNEDGIACLVHKAVLLEGSEGLGIIKPSTTPAHTHPTHNRAQISSS